MTTWITPARAAEIAGVAPRTLRSWLTKGHLTRYRAKDGYHVLIDLGELSALMTRRRERYGAPVDASPPG
jgi:predicted site-specific integrase-resolvase